MNKKHFMKSEKLNEPSTDKNLNNFRFINKNDIIQI